MQNAEDREATELRLLPRGQQNSPHVTQRSSGGVTYVRLLLPFPCFIPYLFDTSTSSSLITTHRRNDAPFLHDDLRRPVHARSHT